MLTNINKKFKTVLIIFTLVTIGNEFSMESMSEASQEASQVEDQVNEIDNDVNEIDNKITKSISDTICLNPDLNKKILSYFYVLPFSEKKFKPLPLDDEINYEIKIKTMSMTFFFKQVDNMILAFKDAPKLKNIYKYTNELSNKKQFSRLDNETDDEFTARCRILFPGICRFFLKVFKDLNNILYPKELNRKPNARNKKH